MKHLLIMASSIALIGCATAIEDYPKTKNDFVLEEYFDGYVVANGMIQDYSNEVTRRFCVDIDGTWENKLLTLDETFYFDDGELDTRKWEIYKTKEGYEGSANDIEGLAKGKSRGFAFQWQYDLEIETGGNKIELHVDDWLYQLSEREVMNRSALTKFGIEVGQITLHFTKDGEACKTKLKLDE